MRIASAICFSIRERPVKLSVSEGKVWYSVEAVANKTSGNVGATYTESLLLAKRGLGLHCIRIIVSDEPTVSAHTLGGNGPLVNLFLRSSSW